MVRFPDHAIDRQPVRHQLHVIIHTDFWLERATGHPCCIFVEQGNAVVGHDQRPFIGADRPERVDKKPNPPGLTVGDLVKGDGGRYPGVGGVV